MDTKGFLCLDSKYECPINDLQFSNAIDPKYETPDYKRLDLNNHMHLYVSNKQTDKQMIVNTELAESEICIYPDQKLQKAGSYKLMNQKTVSYCSALPSSKVSVDVRYKKRVPYDKENLYKDNNLYYDLTRLPRFDNSYLRGDQSLFSRSYIHWSDECLAPNNGSKVGSITTIKNNFYYMKVYFWLILFLFIIMTIINIVGTVCFLKTVNLRYQHVIIGKGILLLNYLAFAFISKSTSLQNDIKEFMLLFSSNKCSDSITNSVLLETLRLFIKVESIQKVLFYIWKYFIYIIMTFSFLLFVPLIYKMIFLKVRLISL